MIRVGIAGFGFMGKMHLRCYQQQKDVQVVAICDADTARLKSSDGAAGNIAGAEAPPDLTGIHLYDDFDAMLAKEKLDAVSITLPTFLHRDFSIKALEVGVNVLCEKPMAMNTAQCEDMIVAAQQANKVLQVGHCIRFWPEYAWTKQTVASGKYGQALVCSFRRLTSPPTWSWDNWLIDKERSGGALMDLHIHDTDYVLYLFGMPKAVHSVGVTGRGGGFDYVSTQYIYKDNRVVTAEGGFVTSPRFGFEMSFNVVFEKAVVVYDCTRNPAFRVCPAEGDAFAPQFEPGDGYLLEIIHFVKKVTGADVPQIITPTDSLNAVKLTCAEKYSAQSKKEVAML